MSAISSVIPSTNTEPTSAPADGPASNLLSFAASVGVDDAFANLGVPYGATDTPANAYTTFLAGVGVDDVFANVAGVGAVAGIGDPITTLGHTGDEVAAGQGGGTGLLGSGPSLETTADAPGPVSNLLSFVASVGVDDAFANLGVPYGATDTPANAYTTYLAGVGVDDAFANAAGVGAVAGVGDPVAIVGNLGDDVVAALGPTLGGGAGAAQFEFPALGGTGVDSLVGEVGHLADLPIAGGAGDTLPLATGADAPALAATAEPLADGTHIIPEDTPLHGQLI